MKSGERCRKVGRPKWLWWHARRLPSFLSCAVSCYGNTSNPVIEMQLARAVISPSNNNATFKRHSCCALRELLFVSCRFQISMSSTPDSFHSVKFFFFIQSRVRFALHMNTWCSAHALNVELRSFYATACEFKRAGIVLLGQKRAQ